MAYSDFTIDQVIDQFELTAATVTLQIELIAPSLQLESMLKRALPLAATAETVEH